MKIVRALICSSAAAWATERPAGQECDDKYSGGYLPGIRTSPGVHGHASLPNHLHNSRGTSKSTELGTFPSVLHTS